MGVELSLKKKRVLTLAYADIVLMAEEEEMRSMAERLEGYLDKKRLEM